MSQNCKINLAKLFQNRLIFTKTRFKLFLVFDQFHQIISTRVSMYLDLLEQSSCAVYDFP